MVPPRPALAFGARTHVMGVINLTPDSFSDGGRIKGAGKALALARGQRCWIWEPKAPDPGPRTLG